MLLAVLISSYECTWEVWRALKKLELLKVYSYASFILSKLPACIHTTRYKHTKHEKILKFYTELKVTILLISPFTCNMW